MLTSPPLARFVTRFLPVLAGVLCLPLIALSFYNHPSPADDYCFANTAMQYGFWQAQRFYYDGWSGRFFHNFIVHSSPLTVGWYAGYKLYPLALLALLGLGFYVLSAQWLRTAGAGLTTRLALAAGLFVGFTSTLASLPEFLYWYAGMACYSLSVVFFLLLLATLIAHQRRDFTLDVGYLLPESLLVIGIIGSSETSMVMVMSVLALLALGEFVQRRRVSVVTLVLLGVGAVGCYYLLAAPGNAIRMGTNPNSSNIPLTLLSSLPFAGGYLAQQLFLTPLLPLSLLYVPLAWQLVGDRSITALPPYLRLHPLWGLLHGSATVVVLISLHFYGVGIPPVPRLINLINLVFWLSWAYNLTLLVVAWRGRIRPVAWQGMAGRAAGLLGLVWTVAAVGLSPVAPMAYGDWLSGRAAQYDRAMQQRYEQLSASGGALGRVAPLPYYPASLFLEDVKNDPQHLWNRCWANYYHKKNIVLREEERRKM